MSHEDMERRLRAERGPREEGYSPTNLPATFTPGRAGAGSSRLVRIGAFATVAGAGAIAVALLGGAISGGHPGVGGTTSKPSASAVAGLPECGSADVALNAEPWGGAAGSRGTNVTIVLASGRSDCLLAPVVGAIITDGGGQRVVSVENVTSGPPRGASVPLASGTSYTVGILWSDWCGAPPAGPVGLALHFRDWASPSTVTVAGGDLDPVPPCNGGNLSRLSVTGLQAN